jgi:hypothetical protein
MKTLNAVYFLFHPDGEGWIDVSKADYDKEKVEEDKWKLYKLGETK